MANKEWLMEAKQKVLELRNSIKKATPDSVKKYLPSVLAALVCVILIEELFPKREAIKLAMTLCVGRWIFPSLENVLEKILRRI